MLLQVFIQLLVRHTRLHNDVHVHVVDGQDLVHVCAEIYAKAGTTLQLSERDRLFRLKAAQRERRCIEMPFQAR